MNSNYISPPLRILLVEDSEHDLLAFRRAFQKSKAPCEIVHYARAEEALERLNTDAASFDLVVSDYKLPGMSGLALCLELLERKIALPLVLVTGTGSEHLAVEALKAGVDDYLIKDPGQGYLNLLPVVLSDVVRKYDDRLARQRAEKALHESETKHRIVADNTYDWEFWLGPEGQFVYTSPSCQRITGHTAAEFMADPGLFDRIIHPDDCARFDNHRHTIEQLRASGEEVQFRIIGSDGRQRWISHVCQPVFDNEGRFLGTRGSHRDITERKWVEAERETLIAQLETKNTELERFSYTISHDLKSPLITIQGFLGYLEQDALTGNIKRLKADIARIVDVADKMHQLLNNLLELSRIGRFMNPPEMVSLDQLAHEAVDMVAGRLAQRGITVDIAPNLPMVYGDRLRLREVLENLLDNAVKYIGDQLHPRVEIGVRRDGPETVFYVHDNGMGIDPSYHPRIFGLFDKLDQKTEGTGIGLTIVKRIVEVHGGRIWVESEGAGKGSTFCFTLASRPELKDVTV